MLDWDNLTVRIGHGFGRVRCEPGWELRPGWVENLRDLDLWFVAAGRGWMQLKDRRVALRPGSCFWMRPGRLYVAQQDLADRLVVNFIHFSLIDARGREILEHQRLPAEHREVGDVVYVDSLMRRVIGLVRPLGARAGEDPGRLRSVAGALLKGLLCDIDAQLPHDAPTAPGRRGEQAVRQAMAMMAEDPGAEHAVAAMAERAHYSPDHFSRLFKEVAGCSPRHYHVQVRLARARQLLVETELAIGQIAAALGYRDVFFFSRQFKQNVGDAPSTYRRRMRTSVGLR